MGADVFFGSSKIGFFLDNLNLKKNKPKLFICFAYNMENRRSLIIFPTRRMKNLMQLVLILWNPPPFLTIFQQRHWLIKKSNRSIQKPGHTTGPVGSGHPAGQLGSVRQDFVPTELFTRENPVLVCSKESEELGLSVAPQTFRDMLCIKRLYRHLSNPKPGHTTGRSGQGTQQGSRAGSGRISCQQNCSPRKNQFLYAPKSPKSFASASPNKHFGPCLASKDFTCRIQNPDIPRAGRVRAPSKAAGQAQAGFRAN